MHPNINDSSGAVKTITACWDTTLTSSLRTNLQNMALHIPPHLPPLLQMTDSDRPFELTSWRWCHETILVPRHSWSQTGAGTQWTRQMKRAVHVTTGSTPSPWETAHLILCCVRWETHWAEGHAGMSFTAHWIDITDACTDRYMCRQ